MGLDFNSIYFTSNFFFSSVETKKLLLRETVTKIKIDLNDSLFSFRLFLKIQLLQTMMQQR